MIHTYNEVKVFVSVAKEGNKSSQQVCSFSVHKSTDYHHCHWSSEKEKERRYLERPMAADLCQECSEKGQE